MTCSTSTAQMASIEGTSPIGARPGSSGNDISNTHASTLFRNYAVLQPRQVHTEINSNPQATHKLENCIQDASQTIQADG